MKKIVVDFDNTLCFSENGDIENGIPILNVIEKLKKYKESEEGAYIIVETARGHYSCKTREEAEKKFRPKIEKFLKKHKIPYDEISFNKRLFDVYIDDKAINTIMIDDFEILSGMSGNTIIKMGKKVLKFGYNLKNEIEWIEKVEKIEKLLENKIIPKYFFLSENFISMEYIKSEKIEKEDIKKILDLYFNTFKKIKVDEDISLNEFIEIVENKLIENEKYLNEKIFKICKKAIKFFKKNKEDFEIEKNFTHGDFFLKNILKNKDKFYFIDGLYKKDRLKNYLFDISKMLLMDYEFVKDEFKNYFSKEEYKKMIIFAIIKFILILPYYKYKSKDYFETIKKLYKELKG